MTDAYLRFDHPNVGYVIDHEEDATVRYGFDRELEEAQHVKLLTPGGNVFGYAEVVEVYTAKVHHLPFDIKAADGRNHPATSSLDLLERLEEHYPDADLTLDSEVTVIYFDLFQVGGAR